MVGRDRVALSRRSRSRSATSCSKSTGLTRASEFRRHQLHRAERRDPRHGRPRRRWSDRGRPSPVRDRSSGFRGGPARWQAGHLRQPVGGHGCRASPTCRRIATRRAWCSTSRSPRTSRCRSCPGSFRVLLVRAPTDARSPSDYTEQFDVKMTRCRAAGRRRSRAATSRRSCWPSGWPPKPRVLILDEPTRGIDIGAKVEVHRIISELAARGWRSS